MIAITGATGSLGSRIAHALQDLSPRLIVRNPARAPVGFTDIRQATYADSEAAVSALEDVDTLLMVSAAESADRRAEHQKFIESAARAGVGHIVYTSFVGASPEATFTLGRDHAVAEQQIISSPMAYTLLRDNFYSDILPFFADEAGVMRGPAGEGRTAAVARADVAAVAALVLRDPAAHRNATYQLTGPEALTMTEVAARAGAALGRELSFVNETDDEAYASRRAGYPDAAQWQLDAWVSTYTAIRDGSLQEVTDDVPRLLGRGALTIEQALSA